jgi:hypothetical protein
MPTAGKIINGPKKEPLDLGPCHPVGAQHTPYENVIARDDAYSQPSSL